MRRTTIFLIVFSVLIFNCISCKKNNEPKETVTMVKPDDYYHYILDEDNKIISKMLDLNKAFDMADARRIDHMLKMLQKQTESSVYEIAKLKPFENDSSLKTSAKKLFEFYKSLSEEEYVDLSDILKKKELSDDDIAKCRKIQKSIIERESPLDINFTNAQNEFAAKYGFQLKSNSKLQSEIKNKDK